MIKKLKHFIHSFIGIFNIGHESLLYQKNRDIVKDVYIDTIEIENNDKSNLRNDFSQIKKDINSVFRRIPDNELMENRIKSYKYRI